MAECDGSNGSRKLNSNHGSSESGSWLEQPARREKHKSYQVPERLDSRRDSFRKLDKAMNYGNDSMVAREGNGR
ncbi:hypothetical protein CDL15_Pgr009235 [Punica granatum]|uniref:Uncharacterized protein n=1 Tax=Punica granatum TaxID=22663 RepID=A0A218WWD4_PUNGR|nr:hypothetical protein CDL15_Pgr009235 [Punica granatum]